MNTTSVVAGVGLLRGLAAAGIAVALASACAGCARLDRTSPSAVIVTPTAMPTGVWRGTISGLEMADAGGLASASAELKLNPDGTFVLEDSTGARARGQAQVVGHTLVLDGELVSPASRVGERVMERLRLGRGNALYGTVDTLFRGLKVKANAALAQVM